MLKRIGMILTFILVFILLGSIVWQISNSLKSHVTDFYRDIKIMDDKEEKLNEEQLKYIKVNSNKTNNVVEKLFLEGFILELNQHAVNINEKYDEVLKLDWQHVNPFITLHVAEYEIIKRLNTPSKSKEIFKMSKQVIHSLSKEELLYYQKQVWDILYKVITVEAGPKEVISDLRWILKQCEDSAETEYYLQYLLGLTYVYDYIGDFKVSMAMYFNLLERALLLKDHTYMIANVVYNLAECVASVGEVEVAMKIIKNALQIPIKNTKEGIHSRNLGYYTLLYIGLEYDKLSVLKDYIGYLRLDDSLLTPKEQEYLANFKEYVLVLINNEASRLDEVENKFAKHLQRHQYDRYYNEEKYIYNIIRGDRYFCLNDYTHAEESYKEAMEVNNNPALGVIKAFKRIIAINIKLENYDEVNRLMKRYHEDLDNKNKELNDTYGQYIVHRVNDKLKYLYAVEEKSEMQKKLLIFLFVSILTGILIVILMKRYYKRNHFDELTSAYTYKRYVIKVKECLKVSKEPYVLINVDILNFKLINLIEGFKEGDKLLLSLVQLMNEMKGKGAIVGRIGNDVFSIFMEKRKYQEFLESLIHKMKYASNHDFVQLSIGVYEIENTDENVSYMIECANTARIISKKNQNHITIFDEHMILERKHQNDIEEEMKKAIEKEEFFLQFQPKFMSHSKELVGFEGLIRWRNEKLGFIRPDQFIGIAERTGYISQIGRWVFEEVCKTQREWLDKGYEEIPISFNLSRIELFQEDLLDFYNEILQYYNIPVHLVEIEITESVALENKELFIRQIKKLKAGGFKISIDDFGTGNSNLSNLKDMDVDTIKIDRSLMDNIETEKKSQDIIMLIKDLCNLWDVEVVCEGVENANQVALLNQRATWIIQGYVFSKPLMKEDAEKLLHKNNM